MLRMDGKMELFIRFGGTSPAQTALKLASPNTFAGTGTLRTAIENLGGGQSSRLRALLVQSVCALLFCCDGQSWGMGRSSGAGTCEQADEISQVKYRNTVALIGSKSVKCVSTHIR